MSDIAHDNILPTKQKDRNLGLLGTIFLWTAATLVTPTVMTGQMFIPSISAFTAFWMVILASAIGCMALGATALIGSRTGLPTFVIARSCFGFHGAKIFAVINAVILAGWGVIQGYLGALALNKATTALFGFDNIILAIFITQGLVLVITILGHTGIQKIEGVVSSLMLVAALSVTYKLLNEHGIAQLHDLPLSSTPELTAAIAFDIVLATAFSWMSSICDYNRYCKNGTTSVAGVVSGYLIGTLIAMGLGILVGAYAIIAGETPTYDPSDIMTGSFAVIGSLVLFASVVSTNVMSLYSAVMSAMSVTSKIKFTHFVIAIGALYIGCSMARELLMESFIEWVLFVGAAMIPVFAIIITDYYWVRRGSLDNDAINFVPGNGISLNMAALITYVVGAVFAVYFTYIDPLSFGATLPAFILSALLYKGLSGVMNRKDLPLASVEQ